MRRLVFVFVAALLPTAVFAQLQLTQVVIGLDLPVALTHAGDGRLFITLQRGQIVIWDGTRILPTPFLDIRSQVLCCDERGLLSVAFHPQYATNGLFFVYYNHPGGDIVIARYRVSSDPNRADPASATILLTIAHSEFPNHNGGQLQFGPDGYLYAGVGDGGASGDPHNHAQDLGELLGKMLRIDIDGAAPYAIPPSNPFVNRPGARPEIWAYGLRNPWRFSFDRVTGDLWIADVGQATWEEIDLQPRTSPGGENYGWRRMEGKHCYNPPTNCNDPSLTPPIIDYSHAEGCSIIGGYRYRGSRVSRLFNSYVFADYCSGTIWGAAQAVNGAWVTPTLMQTSLHPSSFGEDFAGELYILDLGGRVFRFSEKVPARRRAAGR